MTKFSTVEKLQAVIRYQNGTENLKTIAKSIGLHHSVFSKWINNLSIKSCAEYVV